MCWTSTTSHDFSCGPGIRLSPRLSKPSVSIGAAFKGHGMITESDLYAIGQESETADHLMRSLCEALGIQYPPEHKQDTAKRDAMADPLIETTTNTAHTS